MTQYSLLGGILWLLVASQPAWADDHCEPIALSDGESSLSIDGEVTLEDVRCYSLTVGLEKHISIEVLSGHNLVFSIQGQDEASGIAYEVPRRQTFTIVVGQLIANFDVQPYRLTIRLQP
ncbi:hypothetical protein [Halomonas salinarum]|uniref:hypothetical protein n=1 Tax=Halomonas salinarum TaxID=1158993 RepID=UPI00143C923A|nr:hypothetical protein [Halomonas salinarum]